MALAVFPDNWTRALCVVAHPDDLEYGAAGAIAAWTAAGKASSERRGPPSGAHHVAGEHGQRVDQRLGVRPVDLAAFAVAVRPDRADRMGQFDLHPSA